VHEWALVVVVADINLLRLRIVHLAITEFNGFVAYT
jgi:hypothetical protein